MNTISADWECDLNDPPSQPPNEKAEVNIKDETEVNIEDSEYPRLGRLTTILVSLVLSIFLVMIDHSSATSYANVTL